MANTFDLLTESVSKFLVTPLNSFGLGGFVFDIEGETTVNLSTEITDHYLEDNTAVQDHIAIRPKRFTLKSYVGELVYRDDPAGTTIVQQVVRKLTTISGFAPQLAQQAAQAKDALDTIRDSTFSLADISLESVNKTLDYWSSVKNIVGSFGSKQQQAYMYFKALMENKILVSVQTPFEFATNMAIESVTGIQGESSHYISDFSIVLKQIRTVSELSSPQSGVIPTTNSDSEFPPQPTPFQNNGYAKAVDPISYQGRSGPQRLSLQNLGNMDGLSVEDTVNGNVSAIVRTFKDLGIQPIEAP